MKSDLFNKSDEVLLRKCVVFYSAISSESPTIQLQLHNIEQVNQHRVKTDLNPVLRSKEKYDLQSSQLQVKTWLVDLLKLEDNENKFLEAFRGKEYRPNLLFASNEILKRIEHHPMALWKCLNK